MHALLAPSGAPITARCYFSISEALLGVNRVSIWWWMRAGHRPAERLGHRTGRIQREELERLLLTGPAGSRSWMSRPLGAVMAVAAGADSLGAPHPDWGAPHPDWGATSASAHFVQFYEADTFLIDAVAEFIGEALRAGDSGIVVATRTHREGLEARLRDSGLAVESARACGRYMSLDAAETLSHLMVDAQPDPERFRDLLGPIIARAGQGGRRVRIFGEMVALLASAGNLAATTRLEQLWNDLQQSHAFALFCAYPMDELGDESRGELFGSICREHSRVVPAESYTAQHSADDRLRAIALLQQKARRLEAEIAQRKRAEEALREQARTIEMIHRVGQALVAELDQDQLVQAITDMATELTGARFGACFYKARNEQGEVYWLRALSGASREALERFPLPRDTALFEPAVWGSGIVRLDDATQAARYGPNAPYDGMSPGHLPVRSYLATPVISRSGEVLGGLFFGHPEPGMFTERSERLLVGIAAQAAIALDNARLYRGVQEAVRLRDEFLAAASHDLKTPLASIKGLAQLVQRRARRTGTLDSATLLEALERIDATATRANALVETLLDITCMQMGRPLTLDQTPTDLVALARQVVDEQQRTAVRHALRLETGSPELVGLWDAGRLERALGNLVNNAIKYSPAGGEITVTVGPVAVAEQQWAELTVRDPGLGIPASDLPLIFERFQRGQNVVNRIPGTGIGLAAVRQIVEQHGGHVTVESQEGVGTSVTVRLPLGRGGAEGILSQP